MNEVVFDPSHLLRNLVDILDSDPLIDEVGFVHPSQFSAFNEEVSSPSSFSGAVPQFKDDNNMQKHVQATGSASFFWHNEHKLGISSLILAPLYNSTKDAFMDAYRRYIMLNRCKEKNDETLDNTTLAHSMCSIDHVEGEVMKYSMALLLLSCDFGTAWNSRKLILSKKQLFPVFMDELRLSSLVLSYQPKSEQAWSHRRWVLKMIAAKCENLHEIVERESSLVKTLAEKSKMNYRAWNHRSWLVSYMSESQVLVELLRSREWAELHVADNSCFHYRVRLLIQMTENLRSNNPHGLFGDGFHQMWKEELDWVGMLIKRYVGREALWLHRRFLSLVWAKHLLNDQSKSCDDISMFVKDELMLFHSCIAIPDSSFGEYSAQATHAATYIAWLAKQMPMLFGVEIRKDSQYEALKSLLIDAGRKNCLSDSLTAADWPGGNYSNRHSPWHDTAIDGGENDYEVNGCSLIYCPNLLLASKIFSIIQSFSNK